MPGDPFYQTPQWKALRKQIRAHWKRTGQGCAVCGQRIRWDQKPIVDHIKNRRQHPELAHDPRNLQVVCHACNTRKAAWAELSTVTPTNMDGFPDGWDDAP